MKGVYTVYHEVDFIVRNYASRAELRKIVVSKFLKEEPGLGRGDDTSHYRFYTLPCILSRVTLFNI